MISIVQERAKKHGCQNVQTQVADVRDLGVFADETFSHVIVNFGIQATGTSDTDGPEKAAKEIYRVLQKDGVAAVSTWAGEYCVLFNRSSAKGCRAFLVASFRKRNAYAAAQ